MKDLGSFRVCQTVLSPPAPIDPSAVKVSAADFFPVARWPDLEGEGSAVVVLVGFEGEAGKGCVRGGARAGFGEEGLAFSAEGAGQVLPGDRVVDDVDGARIGLGETVGEPVDGIGFLDREAFPGRDIEGGGGASQAVGLVGPDVGEHAQAMRRV